MQQRSQYSSYCYWKTLSQNAQFSSKIFSWVWSRHYRSLTEPSPPGAAVLHCCCKANSQACVLSPRGQGDIRGSSSHLFPLFNMYYRVNHNTSISYTKVNFRIAFPQMWWWKGNLAGKRCLWGLNEPKRIVLFLLVEKYPHLPNCCKIKMTLR